LGVHKLKRILQQELLLIMHINTVKVGDACFKRC